MYAADRAGQPTSTARPRLAPERSCLRESERAGSSVARPDAVQSTAVASDSGVYKLSLSLSSS